MALKTRIIPTLCWDDFSCVKGKAFSADRRVGSMMQAIRVLERRDVDEVIILDITASKDNRPPRYDEVAEFAEQLFCPVTIGGGVREINHIRRLLRAGADKVAIRGASLNGYEFLESASRIFGSQCIVGAMDVRYDYNMIFDHTLDRPLKDSFRPKAWAQYLETCGVGEILLTAVDREGTMEGYDLDLIERVSSAVDIPVIAHGGCGTYEHMAEALSAGAHAVAAGAMFLFTERTPKGAREYLASKGFDVRIEK